MPGRDARSEVHGGFSNGRLVRIDWTAYKPIVVEKGCRCRLIAEFGVRRMRFAKVSLLAITEIDNERGVLFWLLGLREIT